MGVKSPSKVAFLFCILRILLASNRALINSENVFCASPAGMSEYRVTGEWRESLITTSTWFTLARLGSKQEANGKVSAQKAATSCRSKIERALLVIRIGFHTCSSSELHAHLNIPWRRHIKGIFVYNYWTCKQLHRGRKGSLETITNNQ